MVLGLAGLYRREMAAELEELKSLLLNDWDPIGVAGIPEAADEYDSYAFHLHSMLTAGATSEAVAEYLSWAVTSRMELTGNPAHDRDIAERAIALYARIDRVARNSIPIEPPTGAAGSGA
ncbi:hypothetical protein SAMN02745126_00238 [Enhydrobacter aerosaccus]|uniref:Uncharacterized protein n=1 Tax=Enhydrobacter aerosaccus TaxID=225324 RepID=A0A1T4JNE5_9HYPH|nr:hypothetical protein SAMN02745126_00238 [Enhydrobacter aerosaccus]